MSNWAAFAGVATAVTLLLLALTHATSVSASFPTRAEVEWLESLPDGSDHLAPDRDAPPDPEPSLSATALFVNVLVTHGLLLCLLVVAAFFAAIPASAFGLAVSAETVAVGVGFGLALSVVNTAAGLVAERYGYAPSEQLRGILTPETPGGWLLLLGGTLPLVAGFEEFLFRGILVGVFAAGFDASPWALAAVSSVAFALAHESQGRVGILVTGLLGLLLAIGYVLTGSLVVVVVAHYLVNTVELVVFEGLGVRGKQGGQATPHR
ncbi:CPBP family intramembrane glutamic endopeptidase [Halosegnis longus]|uniref:CPBP family intramembrane metalloprotease n=1 Tax=Halosegnis longus TaxID=2216012 RepID=A0AAJ4RA00_9EURY|nr:MULTISPECIES: type II CAAX endopeptidase family protein [Halobacteriales]RNJ26952.1 CPBP family intramembrane metalloprotease [Salella cibi]